MLSTYVAFNKQSRFSMMCASKMLEVNILLFFVLLFLLLPSQQQSENLIPYTSKLVPE